LQGQWIFTHKFRKDSRQAWFLIRALLFDYYAFIERHLRLAGCIASSHVENAELASKVFKFSRTLCQQWLTADSAAWTELTLGGIRGLGLRFDADH
jgi:hypothetical protein